MDKEDIVHTHNGILLSYKQEWNNAICSNIGGPRDYHTKWSKINTIPLLCLWNRKTHRHRE